MRTGQTPVHRYLPKLLQLVQDGKIDTRFLISHHMSLEEGPEGYRMFAEEQDRTTKVVLRP
ncbi:hypothetical protein [Fodinicurvata sp. EGI_FJ10296]|uniref:hypothetical protein n=1 Tax=Fodinicurvata sp. EGI_FJ10296 TaxID=3231908 RepID=UPI0034555E41